MKTIYKTLNYLIVTALVVLALGLSYVAIPLFGNQALIVRSGSMQPAINVGDLVVVKNQQGIDSPQNVLPKYKVGDIVAFKSEKNPKTLTTHRITAVETKGSAVFYRTRGDANNSEDKVPVSENNVIGKSIITLPYTGRVLAFTKSNIGFPLLVILPAILVILFETWALFKEVRRQNRLIEVPAEKSSAVVHLSMILPIFVSVLVIHNSFAFFSDSETSSDNVFVAAESFGPPIAQTLIVNEFLWSSSCTPNPETKFWLELFNGSSVQVNLKDWQFKDGNNNTIQISNSNAFIDPGEYVLITKSNSTFSPSCYSNPGGAEVLNLGGNPDFTPTATGGVIKLEKPITTITFEVVDRVEYGPSQNSGVLNAGTDQSIARSPNGVDSALGDTFAVSDFAVDTTPSPGVSN